MQTKQTGTKTIVLNNGVFRVIAWGGTKQTGEVYVTREELVLMADMLRKEEQNNG